MIKEKAKLFKALSDPNRLRILKMLQRRTLCVCEVKAVLGLASSTVSQHLAILKDAGFIVESKEGKWVNYSLAENPDDPRINAILTRLDFWIDDDETTTSDIQKTVKADRNILCC